MTVLQTDLPEDAFLVEDPEFLRRQLITYIGNKRALLPEIDAVFRDVRSRLGGRRLRMADLFSGTGVVARLMKQHAQRIVANDLEGYSRVANECFLTNRSAVDWNGLRAIRDDLREKVRNELAPGFIARLYAPDSDADIRPQERVFYTRRNAAILDTACRALRDVPEALRPLLLGPLLSEASVHANTSGVFKGFYKNASGVGQFGGSGRDALTRIMAEIEIRLPVLSRFECECVVRQADAAEVAQTLDDCDLVYIDPPYNQHPYGSNYFMLNLLVDYREPAATSRVSGIPVDWNRSVFNRKAEAEAALLDLLERCPAPFVLLSYNSEGFIAKDALLERLSQLGRLSVREIDYNTFRGSRNLRQREPRVTEYLILLERN